MRAAMVIAVAAMVTGCASLPPLEGRAESHAIAAPGGTRLAHAIAPLARAHPASSGVHALASATDAFAARMLLASAAESSIDVQYYIWRGDNTGYLLLEALRDAAERGVRVRLLLDDNGIRDLDETLAVLDAHPAIEVRLYNPFASRSLRSLGYFGDFKRLNRRMHNKSFTVDGVATIVGGRNVGNEYFGAGDETLFADLDVLAVGDVVAEVGAAFDLYWNSASAYPASLLLAPATREGTQRLEEKFSEVRAEPRSQAYLDAVRNTALVRQLLAGELSVEWAVAHVTRDDPAKTLDETERRDLLLLTDLVAAFGRPRRSFDLVSPYFVPGEKGVATLGALARSGVATRVLTNSLAATDVAAVHAGYSKWREPLLRAGVRLYELKSLAGIEAARGSGKKPPGGSSPESLHAKTFASDRERIFVGSFNFDPRSALLNTEMGVVIQSPKLAARLSEALDARLAQAAYELRLTPSGAIAWVERTPEGAEVLHEDEPDTTMLKRAWIGFLSWLPIDWLL
ncbi:MAG TPA: phospholipase D family protein [Usitatibacter sp.]|nr:phospholipase D family protein [Usitatibacter sp.]